jgi:hypothetical protein
MLPLLPQASAPGPLPMESTEKTPFAIEYDPVALKHVGSPPAPAGHGQIVPSVPSALLGSARLGYPPSNETVQTSALATVTRECYVLLLTRPLIERDGRFTQILPL